MANGRDSFDLNDVEKLQAKTKIGLAATISPEGFPHISLIPSIKVDNQTILTLQGRGSSLLGQHLHAHQKMGFLLLTTDKYLWRGKARGVVEQKVEGSPIEPTIAKRDANQGDHVKVVETHGKERLRLLLIVIASSLTKYASSSLSATLGQPILEPWAQELFNREDSLKFASYIMEDGYPVIVPLFHGVARDGRTVDFSVRVYRRELTSLKPTQKVALFAIATDLEQVLVRGSFQGFARNRWVRLGTIHLEWIHRLVPQLH